MNERQKTISDMEERPYYKLGKAVSATAIVVITALIWRRRK